MDVLDTRKNRYSKNISFTVGDGEVLSVLGSTSGKDHLFEMYDGSFSNGTVAILMWTIRR